MRTNELPSDYAWGSLDRKVWQNDQDQLLRSGLLNEPVPLDQVMYTDLQGEYAKFDHASVQAQAGKDAGAGSPG